MYTHIYLYILLIIIVIIIVSLIIIYDIKNIENYQEDNIQHIIRQTAPTDKSKWKQDWYICQESWNKNFPDWQYKLWTDEDNDNFVKTEFPEFYKTYNDYDKLIYKIDMVRYCILYKYGGIYADMDYYCNKNFYNELNKNRISISESPYTHNEYLQNALMISPKNNKFWLDVIEEGVKRWNNGNNNGDVLDLTGPRLISSVYEKNKNEINVLPKKYYNPLKDSPDFNNDNVYTKHYCTFSWSNH